MDQNNARFSTIDAYIATFSKDTQDILTTLRATIRAAAPDAQETISYQVPTFTLKGTLVQFAAHTHHIGFYPAPSGIAAFQDELSAYKRAKGSVQFPLDQPLPLDVIRRIVQFRVAENRRSGCDKITPTYGVNLYKRTRRSTLSLTSSFSRSRHPTRRWS